ncbi:MAG: NADP oxidoreductase, partial [Gammaproteobacteria bacterium]|nr:NADP oxidoreductase [Gammaproteobacteria bacterium]
SGLRGRGGAGFETAKKWRYCRESKDAERYVVCNADEGEPGTFKDRILLTSSAHSVIEGMTVCAYVIGAQKGFIYLRGEYLYLLEHLKEVLIQRRQSGLLGQQIKGKKNFNFDIEIHLGAGAYICGEESALIESLEGKRGIPRIRPPFPVNEGYKNKPTVVNNVETFWSVSRILLKGADWFKQAGTEESTGTRLLSISGDCARPGIYEYPFGITLNKILTDCGGSEAQAVQMAGAAGTMVLAKDFDRKMSFEDLSTGGSFMVIGPQRNLMDVLQNFADFFKHESCGFCTPCRVGTVQIADIIQRFSKGQGCHADIAHLQEVSKLMMISSFCGLGCSAPTSI